MDAEAMGELFYHSEMAFVKLPTYSRQNQVQISGNI
jgi:hypothetical protein